MAIFLKNKQQNSISLRFINFKGTESNFHFIKLKMQSVLQYVPKIIFHS